MNTQALKQLRRVVKAAPDDRFHMRKFVEKAKCGTAYCAAGWAAQDKWFIEHRFPLKKNCELRSSCEFDDHFNALAEFFEISPRDSDRLFGADLSPGSDPHAVTKEQVINNIDRLLKGKDVCYYGCDGELL